MTTNGITLGTYLALMDRLPASAPAPWTSCPACLGCGRVVTSDPPSSWCMWDGMPYRSGLAIIMGLIQVIPCPECIAATRALAHLTPGGTVPP